MDIQSVLASFNFLFILDTIINIISIDITFIYFFYTIRTLKFITRWTFIFTFLILCSRDCFLIMSHSHYATRIYSTIKYISIANFTSFRYFITNSLISSYRNISIRLLFYFRISMSSFRIFIICSNSIRRLCN